jgi:hypothetical protein
MTMIPTSSANKPGIAIVMATVLEIRATQFSDAHSRQATLPTTPIAMIEMQRYTQARLKFATARITIVTGR